MNLKSMKLCRSLVENNLSFSNLTSPDRITVRELESEGMVDIVDDKIIITQRSLSLDYSFLDEKKFIEEVF